MTHLGKVWRDDPDHTTPISAAALSDLESRVGLEIDDRVTAAAPDLAPFSNRGFTSAPPPNANGQSYANWIGADANGKFLLTGQATIGGVLYGAACRLNQDLTVDTTFGTSGWYFGSDPNGIFSSGAVDGSDRYLLVGRAGSNMLLVRLTSTGSLDATFATGGVYKGIPGTLSGITVCQPVSVKLDGSGRHVVAGAVTQSGVNKFFAARFTTAGAVDATWATAGGGAIAFDVDSGGSPAYAGAAGWWMELDSSGCAVIAGEAGYGSGGSAISRIACARLTTAGVLDTTFNSGGTIPGAFTKLVGSTSQGFGLAIQSSGGTPKAGGIIVGGTAFVTYPSVGGRAVPTMLRLTTAGVLDTSFGDSGVTNLQIGDGSGLQALIIQPDDKPIGINIAGVYDDVGTQMYVASRLNSDGGVDHDFGMGGSYGLGIAPAPISGATNYGCVMADGRIVLAGTGQRTDGKPAFGVARLTPTGAVESSTFKRVRIGVNASSAYSSTLLASAGATALDGSGFQRRVMMRWISATSGPDYVSGNKIVYLGKLPPDSILLDCRVIITTAFNNGTSGGLCAVGVPGALDAICGSVAMNAVANLYTAGVYYDLSGGGMGHNSKLGFGQVPFDVVATYAPGAGSSPTTGKALVVLEYMFAPPVPN